MWGAVAGDGRFVQDDRINGGHIFEDSAAIRLINAPTLALPALLLLITVPVSISKFVDALIPPPSPAAWLPEMVLL